MFLTETIFLLVISLFVVNAKPAIDYCQTCQNVNEFISQMRLNQTEKVIETNLYKKCFEENNRSNSEVCIFLSTSIKNTLFSIGSSDFCKKIDACSSKTSHKKLESVSHERCGFCTDFVNSAKSLIEESSLAEIKTVVNDYCSVMGDFQETCENAVRENLSTIIDFVLKKLDSEKFCHSINSCNYQSLEDKKLPSLGDFSSLRNPEVIKGHLDDLYENKVNEIIEPENNLEAGIGCMVCRQVVVFAYHRLSKNATRQELETELSHACKALYPKNKEKEQICEQKVIKNVDVIIRGFVEKIPPELLCLALGFCIGEKEQTIPKEISNEFVKIDLECTICDKVIEFAYHELNLNKTRIAIKHFIEKSCPRIFQKASSRANCQKYIETYTDSILDFFEAGLSPGLICNALHLCKVNENLVNKYDNSLLEMEVHQNTDIENKNVKLDGCQACKTMYPLVYKFLQNQEVRGILKAVVPVICDAKIYPIKDCPETLNNIINTFSTVEDSDVGCKEMNYCINNNLVEQNVFNTEDNFSPRCSACKLMVKDLFNMLNKKINGPDVHRLIEKGCSKIPEVNQEKCKNEAQETLNKVIKQLEETFPPTEVCELMDYCKKSVEVEEDHLKNKKNYCEECKIEANKHLNKFKTFKTVINADQICESMNYCQKKKSIIEKLNKTPAEKACSDCHLFFPFLHIAFQNEEFRRIYTEIGINMCKRCPSKDCVSKLKETIESIAKNTDVEEACKPVCKKPTDKSLSLKFKGLCDDCENLFTSIHKKIEGLRSIKDELIVFLLKTCPEKDVKCKEFYKKNINLVYKKILEVTDPNTACKVLCKNQEKPCKKNCHKKDIKVVKPKKNHCSKCNKFFNRVHQEINNSDLIYKKFTSFFNQAFSEKNNELKFFYENNKELIHQFVLNKTNPEIVCPKSDTCNINALDASTNEDQESLCKGCQKGLLYLKEKLDTPEFQKELADEIVETVCAKIGNILERKLCTKFVNQYGPKLVQQLGNQIVNVDKICTEDLKLCSEQKTSMNFELINFKADEKCSVCMKSVQKLNNNLRENTKLTVKDICGEEDEECTYFMLDFLDHFLKRNDYDDSLKACLSLDFCLSPGKVKLLGGAKCTYGPSYWCISSDHSEACKATDFCRRKVWKTIEN